jgi:iron complex outermembrane receptor protein
VADNWNIAWFGNHTDNFAQDPGSRHDRPFNDGRYGIRDTFNVLTIANKFDKAEGWVKPYYSQASVRWNGETHRTPAGVPTGRKIDIAFDWETYGVRAKQSLFLWEGGEVLLGLDVDVAQAKYESTLPVKWDNHRFTTTSPYAAVSHQFGSKNGWRLTPSVGLRQYWHNEFDAKFSPHAGLVVGYRDTELHFGYARSVVYPGLNVAVFSEAISPPLYNANPKGWKDLSAEIMDHYEIGLSHVFGPLVRAGITAFWNEGRDRYQMYTAPGTLTPAGFDNIGRYRKYGFESSVTVTPLEDLSLFVGAAYLQTEPHTMPFAPQWTLSGGVNWRFLDDFQINVDGMYRSKMYTDSYSRGVVNPMRENASVNDAFLLNAKLSHFFEIPSLPLERGEVFVAVENITNTRYEFSPGYYMPGTSFMVGLSLTF